MFQCVVLGHEAHLPGGIADLFGHDTLERLRRLILRSHLIQDGLLCLVQLGLKLISLALQLLDLGVVGTVNYPLLSEFRFGLGKPLT